MGEEWVRSQKEGRTREEQVVDDQSRSRSAEEGEKAEPWTRFLSEAEVVAVHKTIHPEEVVWREELNCEILCFLHKAVSAVSRSSFTRILSDGRFGERGSHYTTASIMVVPVVVAPAAEQRARDDEKYDERGGN